MNLQIRQLENELIGVLNGSDVPIEAKRLVLLEVLGMAEKEANRIITLEAKQSMETIVEEGDLEHAESTRQ